MQIRKYTSAIALQKQGTLKKKIGTRLWNIEQPFLWYVDYENKLGKIKIPKHFETDFGSIPRVFWWLFNPTKYVAYILHDYLYYHRGTISNGVHYDRAESDAILREALIVEGCTKVGAWTVWLAVRCFGWIYWHFGKNKNS